MTSLAGIRMIESPLAMVTEPNRKHKLRRGRQAKAYHKRVQKKWTKRFGTKQVPFICMVGSDTAYIHPTIYRRLKGAVEELTREEPILGALKFVQTPGPVPDLEIQEKPATRTAYRYESMWSLPILKPMDISKIRCF